MYISNYKNNGKTIYFLICDKTVFVVFGFISIFKVSTLFKLEMFIASSKLFIIITITRKSVHGTRMPPPFVFILPAIKHWVYNK